MAKLLEEVIIPKAGVSDDSYTVLDIYVKHGEYIEKDGFFCSFETSKAVFDVEVNKSGYIYFSIEKSDKVIVGDIIAAIFDEQFVNDEWKQWVPNKKQARELSGNGVSNLSKKAEKLINQNNIDAAVFSHLQLVRERDVEIYLQTRTKVISSVENAFKLKFENAFLDKQEVSTDFLNRISEDSSFANLSSEDKIKIYRENNAIIGDGVKIGKGTIILGNRIFIDDDAVISDNCYIKTVDFGLGRMSVIGSKCSIVSRKVIIGDVFFSGSNILIGGGGAFGQNSGLEVGHSCLISSECIINTTEKVSIGNRVALSPRVQIYTHSHWQNVLEGYSAKYGSVIIGDDSYITGNCLVAAGSNIGKGVTVLGNSLVASNIDDYSVFAGVPGKVISKVDTNLSIEKKEMIINRILRELLEDLNTRGFAIEDVAFCKSYDNEYFSKPVVLTFLPLDESKNKEIENVIFDLTNYKISGNQTRLSDEVRNFLRKRGIRFTPIYWRYTHDKGLYNS